MAAQTQTSSDNISHINDEDVLRKMWQETEDFGKKKEIRSHMYKLREARLREFYNTNEMSNNSSSTETRTITKSSAFTTNKQDNNTHHADSLADQSFLSLKSKEIRDSESPTRDVNYKVAINDAAGGLINKLENREWNKETTSHHEQSNSGKMMQTKRTTTTTMSAGGIKNIEGGKIDYVMENQQKTNIYQDGDDKNFTKAAGILSNSVLQQQAIISAGDENNSFRSTTSRTTASSVTAEHRSETGNVFDENLIRNKDVFIPCDDENTKVTKETKTLPDGSVVTKTSTTTKYITEGGSTKQLEQKSTNTTTSSNTTKHESKFLSENRTSNNNDLIAADIKSNYNQDVVNYESKQSKISETTHQQSIPIEELQSSAITSIQEIDMKEKIMGKDSRKSPVRKSPTKEHSTYVQPDRRQPIKPAKSEMDQKLEPTKGQYDTTYRSDYTQKKISVEVSPTHDAFARSLRSISPDRMSTNSRSSLKNSHSSLRCSTSPEKIHYPSRYSPERRRSASPKKATSQETIIISSRRTNPTKSPERTWNNKRTNIEYIRNVNDVVTDLDVDDYNASAITRNKDVSSYNKQQDKILRRTDTYEERCKQILGITASNTNETRRDSIDKTKRLNMKRVSQENLQIRKSPEKKIIVDEVLRKSPEKQSIEAHLNINQNKKKSTTEFSTEIRKSPEKQLLQNNTVRKSPEKSTKSSSFSSELSLHKRTSPERGEPLEKYPERKNPVKTVPTISEFPSQIRKSPEREPLEKYSERKSPEKQLPTQITEFPSQIRKSPEKQLPTQITEFPSQTRKSPEKQLPTQITEFPSQTRKSPERKSPEKQLPNQITEFPSQKRPSIKNEIKQAKKILKVKKNESNSSSSSSDNDNSNDEIDTVEANEFSKFTKVTHTENKIPVNEPLCTQKFITQLGKDEEIQRGVLSSDSILKETNKTEEHKTVKKDLSAITRKENLIKTTNSSNIQINKTKKAKSVDDENKKNVGNINQKITSATTVKKTDNELKQSSKKQVLATTIIEAKKTSKTNNKSKMSSVIDRLSKPKQITKTKLQNNRKNKSSDENNSEVESDIETNRKQKKFVRTVSDQQIKITHKAPIRGHSKPELFSPTTKMPFKEPKRNQSNKKLEKKCISTKSIIINGIKDADMETKDIIVDLQRSTSSREPTPDRVCPRPLSSEDDDFGVPRYPDRVVEPEEFNSGTYKRKKSHKLIEIPIIEGEDTSDFTRIVDVTEPSTTTTTTTTRRNITEVDKVEETDESLLSVNKKINKFTQGQQTIIEPIKKNGIAPKVERPELNVSEDLKEDECLLSVSDKVSKFITTAEELITPHIPSTVVERPKSPKCLNYMENDVLQKVSQFSSTEKETIRKQGIAPKVPRPDLTNVDENLKQDECLLSVSDKVNKFITTAEKLTNENKKKTTNIMNENKTSTDCVQIENEEQTYTRKPSSPSRRSKSPERRSLNQHKSAIKQVDTNDTQILTSKTYDIQTTPKSSSRTPLKNTDSIKKAKALFEKQEQQDNRELLRQRDILNRPSVFEGRKLNSLQYNNIKYDINNKENRTSPVKFDDDSNNTSLKSARLILDRMKRPQSPERFISCRPKSPSGKFEKFVGHSEEIIRKSSLRETSPVQDNSDVLPSYMKPLDRRVRPNSPHKTNINYETDDNNTTKFGVTLRRNSSGRLITNEERKSSISDKHLIHVTEEQIEDIFELEILEKLLEKIVNYEIRRKIRAQIRLVKKLIQENTLKTYILQKRKSQISPERTTNVHKTEYQSSYNYERRSSNKDDVTTIRRRCSKSPEVIIRCKSPQNKQSPERKIVKKITTTADSTFTNLKKIQPVVVKETIDDKPEWVKQRNLRKTNDSTTRTSSYSTTTTRKETTKRTTTTSPVKEVVKSTDLITSSYGVGPTDENGTPLFGLRALRSQKKATDTKTKVQGTMIQSECYTKNGDEPIGQISVTKYSNDPKDFDKLFQRKTNNGLTSITTTQKFGYKDTPSLKNLTTNESSSKITRRDSVKSLSQKFIENTVESLKSENKQQQSTYPRAGLILRTSSFKDSKLMTDKSRDTTPEKDNTSVFKTKTTVSTCGETFFSNRNPVSGVKDVINRMKGDDTREGDTKEDIEARSLLNKFIGSQVLLSGMESGNNLTTKKTTTTTTTPQTKMKTECRTTKITSTVTESGKPKSTILQFQRPITEKDLKTIWEEHILRLLLEQSSDYEERRLIRARLRQVMAEQEACADLVEKASQEQQTTEQIEGKQTSTTTKQIRTKGPVTTEITRVTTQISKKPISPFMKFRQLDKQNSLNTPPSTPNTPSGSGPLFKFTDPALSQSASTIKDRLLHWCRMKTKEYENIQLDNFSTSWADGLAFCALIHHFLPEAFDYHTLTPKNRRHNFTLAFQIADEKADIAPLLDVDDMVATRKPDWKCVFTYVQSIYRRFKDED